MKISEFLKTHFSSIIFTFIDDFTLNSDNNKEFEVLYFVALDTFFKQRLDFADKN
jgi:hypothetical protein